MSLQIQFPPHRRERTPEGTTHVNANAVKFSGNCAKIMHHWQKQNIPLTDDTARLWLDVRNLAKRIADLRENGVVILDTWVKDTKERNSHKKYNLGCTCSIPGQDTTNCYLHSEKLKV